MTYEKELEFSDIVDLYDKSRDTVKIEEEIDVSEYLYEVEEDVLVAELKSRKGINERINIISELVGLNRHATLEDIITEVTEYYHKRC